MKKNIWLTGIIFIVMLAALIGCGKSKQNTIKLYFANAEKTELKCEERPFESDKSLNASDPKHLENVVNELLKGPADSPLVRVIPDGTKLLSLKESDGVVTLDFSSEYNTTSSSDELLARHSVAKTLFEIDGINKIKIFVSGVELMSANGDKVGEISKDSLVTTPTQNTTKYETVTLYFSDDAAMYLIPEARAAALVDNSIEKTIITELMKGPENKAHKPTIPDGTKLISVETKDGICFVNFSQEFVSKHNGGSAGEYMTIYSIVNSLTELDHIQKVQFLIDGNKLEVFKHMVFNEPFERDNSIIAK